MRRLHPVISIVAVAALAFLYLPLVGVALFSFNSAQRGFVWTGFTIQWYARVTQNADVLAATWNTALLAVVSMVIATVIGTLLALGVERFPWPRWFSGTLDLIMHLPVVSPDIILAAALVVALGILQLFCAWFEPGMFTMIIGHVTFEIPFVALVVRGRLAMIDRSVDEAARDLYASNPYLLRKVTLPLILPGIAAGAMLAFTLSLDDFVISFFTSSPDSTTLPIYIYGELRRGITAGTQALSTLIFAATVLVVLVLQLWQMKTRRD